MLETGAYSRCTAVLSFYDESLEMLAACVSSLAGVVDHLVAVDGAYLHFPDAKPASDPAQMRLIAEICSGLRIGLTTHTPTTVWGGNEVQKRSHAMKLAEAVTNPDGWYFIHDADCVVTTVSGIWFDKLDEVREQGFGAMDIAVKHTSNAANLNVSPAEGFAPIRLMYRALRGMRYGPAHWVVSAPDPDTGDPLYFWGPRSFGILDAYDGTHLLRIEHRGGRAEYRRVDALKYYSDRESLGLESLGQNLVRDSNGGWREL